MLLKEDLRREIVTDEKHSVIKYCFILIEPIINDGDNDVSKPVPTRLKEGEFLIILYYIIHDVTVGVSTKGKSKKIGKENYFKITLYTLQQI